MPSSGAALVIALAMVPGYLCLQLTREMRRPQPRSALGEVLEILAVGLGTSGLAVTGLILLAPQTALAMLNTLQEAPSQLTVADIRQTAGVVAVLLIVAVLLAWAAAQGSRKLLKQRYPSSVLKETLGLVKDRHASVVAIHLTDGSTVDGILHAYSLDDDESTRIIALKAPVRRLRKGDKAPVVIPTGYFIAFGSDIEHVSMTHILDPGAKRGRTGGRSGFRRRKPERQS